MLGETITFDATDSYDLDGDIDFYYWNFDDGRTSNQMVKEHTYTNSGIFNVSLKLIDNLPENKPWLSFFHIEELHSLREGSTPVGLENFDDPKFGSTRYERIVSHIDFWIGKILDKIYGSK